MKKLLILLSILICLAIGGSVLAISLIGSGITSVYTCASGTYMFDYDGDYNGDTDKACFTDGGANKDGTIVDATVTSDYVEYSASDDYITWDVASEDGICDTLGTIYFSVYIVDDGDIGENALIESINGNDKLAVFTNDSTNGVYGMHAGNNGAHVMYVASAMGFTIGTWVRVGHSWQTGIGGNDHALAINAVGAATTWQDEDDDDLLAWNANPDDITIGENAIGKTVNDTVRIKDVRILSTYKATDPLAP